MKNMRLISVVMSIAVLLSASCLTEVAKADSSDYSQALELCFHFFEAQRSGQLPTDNRVSWRSDSGLQDGTDQGLDLTGGYYDAGDNVKFGFPMAYTISTLSWSVIAYGKQLDSQGQLQTALDAIRWGTDYFIKAHPEANVLWAEVGDGDSDHACWERPEDMTTSREAYKIDVNNPGSEVVAETAAAMAAASIALSASDSSYSSTLLAHAKQLFTFADTYRGHYDASIPAVKDFYGSGPSGYNDELLWAAAWLFEATDDTYYLEYLVNNADALGGTGWGVTQFSWDLKYAGVQVLATKILLEGRGGAYTDTLQAYKTQAEYFMCANLGENSDQNVARSPGGMLFIQSWNNMQYVTSGGFLTVYYADLLSAHDEELTCSGNSVQPSQLFNVGKSQADYILGNNPKGESYMVGYGQNFPQFVHHRGASWPSIFVDSTQEQCNTGYSSWYSSSNPNPNVLVGAIVGGPGQDDSFDDSRSNYEQNEACGLNNSPLVGLLARLASDGDFSTSTLTSLAATAAIAENTSEITAVSTPKALNTSLNTTVSTPKALLDAKIRVTQKVVQKWKTNGIGYYKYLGTIINKSGHTLKNFTLNFAPGLDGPSYGLSKVNNSTSQFTFPSYQKSLLSGKSLKFVYISRHSKPSLASLTKEELV